MPILILEGFLYAKSIFSSPSSSSPVTFSSLRENSPLCLSSTRPDQDRQESGDLDFCFLTKRVRTANNFRKRNNQQYYFYSHSRQPANTV